MTNFDPTNITPYVGKSFITRNSRYQIVSPSQYKHFMMLPNGKTEVQADSGELTVLAGIPNQWNIFQKVIKNLVRMADCPADELEDRTAIAGGAIYTQNYFKVATAESKKILINFLKRYGQAPQEKYRLVLGLNRDFDFYQKEYVNNGRSPISVSPIIITSQIQKIQ